VIAVLGVALLGTPKGIVIAIIFSLTALAEQTADRPVYVLGSQPCTNVFRSRSRKHPENELFPELLLLRIEGVVFFLNAQRVVALDLSAVP